jgi:hypothetical protein
MIVMFMAILWIFIDLFMVVVNYDWAKTESKHGDKFWSTIFTIFTALWIIFLGADIINLISLIGG